MQIEHHNDQLGNDVIFDPKGVRSKLFLHLFTVIVFLCGADKKWTKSKSKCKSK